MAKRLKRAVNQKDKVVCKCRGEDENEAETVIDAVDLTT